jgi:hypothetical protein
LLWKYKELFGKAASAAIPPAKGIFGIWKNSTLPWLSAGEFFNASPLMCV